MKKCFLTILAVLLIASTMPVFAMYYSKGDTEFTVRAGGIVPAVIYRPFMTADFTEVENHSKLIKFGDKDADGKALIGSSIGGSASLSYQGFTSPKMCLGGEIGFDFLYTNGKDFFTIVPLTFKATYIPVQNGKFDVNLHLNAGAALLKYRSTSLIPAPYLRLTVNPTWFFSKSWGLGVETGVSAVGEFWFNDDAKPRTTILGSVPVTLTAIYRH